MSVLIKGMEMPKSCVNCPIAFFDDEYAILHCPLTVEEFSKNSFIYKRSDKCPLVPVPPHGDLIDYDFCMENYELLHDDDGNPVYAVRMRDINIAPAIIQAEEVE